MLQCTKVYGVPAKCYSVPRCIGCLLMLQCTQVYEVPAKCYSVHRYMGCLLNVTVYTGIWDAC